MIDVTKFKGPSTKPVQSIVRWLDGKGFDGWLLPDTTDDIEFFIARNGIPQTLKIPKSLLDNYNSIRLFLTKFLNNFEDSVIKESSRYSDWKSHKCEYTTCMVTFQKGTCKEFHSVHKVEILDVHTYRIYFVDNYPIVRCEELNNVKSIQLW